ncbi:MAG: hypothetical protein Q7K26_04185 [bacterium]|nr:hypothetical protein [bacterium]
MRYPETKRYTRVLVFGLSDRRLEDGRLEDGRYIFWWSSVKDGLKGMHKGWTFISAATSNIHDTLKYITEHEDLEIVSIVNEYDWARCATDSSAKRIAEAITRHPYRPWVFLDQAVDGGFDFLKSVFEGVGVKVVEGELCRIIHERWCAQGEEGEKR